MRVERRFLFALFMAGVAVSPGRAQGSAQVQVDFFEKQIRPLLVEHCVVCHGPRVQQGQLRLDSALYLRQGGQSGPVVVPGDVAGSRLIQLVRGKGALQMPPTEPLTRSQILALEQWVQTGAIWPEHRMVRGQKTGGKPRVIPRAPDHPELASDLHLWLKADAIEVKEDRLVLTWPDSSGRGNHWLAPPATESRAAPELVQPSRVHQRPALRFDGKARLVGSESLARKEGAPHTTFVVARFEPRHQDPKPGRAPDPPPSTLPLIVTMTRQSGEAQSTARFHLNGSEAHDLPAIRSFMGAFLDGRIAFQGDLAEVITYDTVRTASERQSVEAYLGEKYDILLPWDLDEVSVDFTEEERSFWAFQPVKHYETPEVQDQQWPRSWLDRFVLAKLEAEGLRPAPQADKRTLIRRLYFNLTGLPPPPEEVEAFVNDASPVAYINRVESLLASPHYGERWGRHWLDVARYADSTAHDGNYIMRYAYRYRDYVVQAFNSDKPYDQFIDEQIAGDLLPGDPDWQTFRDRITATGFLVLGPKALAEQDKEKFVLDVIDEQIDVIGRTFLGLTLSCSRCHDHKFDPIPTADYYSLAAILKGTQIMADLDFVSKWQEWPLVSELQRKYPEEFPTPDPSLTDFGKARQSTTKCSAEAHQAIDGVFNNYQETDDGDPSPWWEVKLAESSPVAMVVLWNRVDAEEAKRLSNFRVSVLTGAGQLAWSQVFFADGEEHPAPAEGFRICTPAGTSGQIVRVELLGPRKKEAFYLHLAEVQVFAAGDCSQPPPEPLTVMAVKDGSAAPMRILVRGNHANPGKLVPRRFLQILADRDNPVVESEQSGRLELARAIAHADNPLTARVMVNRIWQWHFGTGLVSSSDNFGALGDRPSHPELLDRLAAYFVESGWSIKQLHRLILESSTYRMQSGVASPEAEILDANNRWLWRFPRRRLEVEALRDAILSISGRLDQTMGGSIFDYKGKSQVDDHFRGLFSATKGGYSFEAYQSARRSLYLPVVRNQIFPLFQIFDFAGSNAVTTKRSDSTVSTQALFMMNSAFAKQQARDFAERLLLQAGRDDAGCVRLAHQRLLGRDPSEDETEQALAYLREVRQARETTGHQTEEARRWAYASYCQLLFSLNEFMYIE